MQDNRKHSSFHVAAAGGHAEVLRELAREADDYSFCAKSAPPLHRAAYYGRWDVAAGILSSSVDPDMRDETGDTALHRASHAGHSGLVALLLDVTANIEAKIVVNVPISILRRIRDIPMMTTSNNTDTNDSEPPQQDRH